ncbi:adhesion G-protein coupled receptor D1-like [Tubulanus polymorphus]|uniref:adhesion G-protein coupled receptor D1-like n=1 Tax=Tubulanus polymorphus TaxID=672921 RepID=UPI003DA6CD85
MNDAQQSTVLKSWNKTVETRVAAAQTVYSLDEIVTQASSRLVEIGHQINTTLEFVQPHAEVNIKMMNRRNVPVKLPESGNVTGSVSLLSYNDVESDPLAVATTTYKSIQSVLPNEIENISHIIGSNIIGVSIVSNNTGLNQLKVDIEFPIPGCEAEPKCVFLQKEKSNKSSEGDVIRWSGDGCSLVDFVNDSGLIKMVKCRCNHTTNFAVLLQVKSVKLSSKDTKALEIITYIGCTLSILGTTLTILTFIFLRMYTDRVLVHVNLALAILFSQTLLLAGSGVQRNTSGCVAVTVLLFYFYLSSFSWMLIEGIHIYLQVIVVFASETKMKLYYICGWGLPLLVVAVAGGLFHDTIGTHEVCWLSPNDNSIWAFAVPALTIVFINLVILFRVMYVIVVLSVTKEDSKMTSAVQAAKASLVLLPVLGTTWIFGVLAFSEKTVVFQYVFALTNSLQGLLLFVCHCLINTEVREVFYRRKSAWESSHGTMSSRVEPSENRSTPNARNNTTGTG